MTEEIRIPEINLLDQALVLRKRKKLIAVTTAFVVLLVAFFSFTMTPVYKAGTRLIIERNNPNVVSMEEFMSLDTTETDYYQTQYEILKSKAVAKDVAKRLDLYHSQEFFPDKLIDVSAIISAISFWKSDEDREREKLAEAEEKLLTNMAETLDVAPVRNSRIVDVSFVAKDPELAAKIANAYAQAYIDHNMAVQLNAINVAVEWLNKRIAEERTKLEDAQLKFQEFRERNGIVTDFTDDAENVTAQRLSELNKQVIEAHGIRVELESKYNQTREALASGKDIGSIPEVLQNEFIQSIKESEVELSKNLSELAQKKGPNHPQIKAIKAEIGKLQGRMRQEAQMVVGALRSEFEAALAREEALREALDDQKVQALGLNKLSTEYNVLKRDVQTTEEMHDLLMKRFKEASLKESLNAGNVRVVDEATVPQKIYKPQKLLNVALGLVVGLFLGIALAFLAEHLDDTIKTPEDVKNVLGVPFLGHIPAYEMEDSPSAGGVNVITLNSPKSIPSEAYRGLRTSIMFSKAEKSPQVIQVSSSSPGEGKSTTSSNLAAAFAMAGSKTLLIDCDMRKPSLHKIFSADRNKGITNILTSAPSQNGISFATNVENLSFCPVGPLPPNPSELIGSARMGAFIKHLREKYDRIIIDTPPVTAVTDAAILANYADGVILVVEAFETSRKPARNALERLKASGATILGVILNNVQSKDSEYYHNEYYYYYYGDDDGSGTPTNPRKKNILTRIQ